MPVSERRQVEIYTDGACDPNPGPGGWGAVLLSDLHTKEISGADPVSTNNRMELTAAIEALRLLKRPCEVELYTDSQYLRNGITRWVQAWRARGWRKANGQPVENVDLWQELVEQAGRHQVAWHWVRGHRGNPLNERADELARRARRGAASSARPAAAASAPTQPPADDRSLPRVDIYPRGSALGNPGPAGYAAVLVYDGERTQVVSKGWDLATNNVMELWAVVAGLRALRRPSQVTVYTTSKYVLDGATKWLAGWERNGWRTAAGGPVRHREIWEELGRMLGDHDVAWRAVRSGESEPHSQRAAQAAGAEAQRARADRATD